MNYFMYEMHTTVKIIKISCIILPVKVPAVCYWLSLQIAPLTQWQCINPNGLEALGKRSTPICENLACFRKPPGEFGSSWQTKCVHYSYVPYLSLSRDGVGNKHRTVSWRKLHTNWFAIYTNYLSKTISCKSVLRVREAGTCGWT